MQADHYKVIRAIGAASTVLLKNTGGALPLNLKSIRRAYSDLLASPCGMLTSRRCRPEHHRFRRGPEP